MACAGCDREFDNPLYLQLDHISNHMHLCGRGNQIKSHRLTLNGLRAETRRRGRMTQA